MQMLNIKNKLKNIILNNQGDRYDIYSDIMELFKYDNEIKNNFTAVENNKKLYEFIFKYPNAVICYGVNDDPDDYFEYQMTNISKYNEEGEFIKNKGFEGMTMPLIEIETISYIKNGRYMNQDGDFVEGEIILLL